MKQLKVPLIGQPNVGKSSLLNALAGTNIIVSNYPGTTVELSLASRLFGDTRITFEDTPGIYSISDRSEEEKVTKEALFVERVDRAVVVADATSIERSLYLALQILEAQVPVVIAVNFIEDAERKRIRIDYGMLSEILHVPVFPVNPLKGQGMTQLVNALLNYDGGISDRHLYNVEYDDHIEEAIQRISARIQGTWLPARFVALRLLEGDADFSKYLVGDRLNSVTGDSLEHHPKVSEDVAITRYGTAGFIAELITRMDHVETPLSRLQDRLDDILLDNVKGPVGTILFFVAVFGMLLYLGNFIEGQLMSATEALLSSLTAGGNGLVTMLLLQGLTGVAAGVSIALPYVFLFYLLLALLEDAGILSRFIVNLDRFLKRLGLPGKAFIPLMLGFGCTAPATTATRILSSRRLQFHAASLFAFVPCSSRIGIVMGVVGYFGGVGLALSVFATLAGAGFVWALAAKKLAGSANEPLLLELPPYRRPLVKNVAIKSWIRMKEFVYVVIPLLAIGGIAYGVLDAMGLTQSIVQPLAPVAYWLGLPAATVVPLIYGFLQKDLTGAMLLSVFGTDVSAALNPLQLYTFGVAATIGIPCIIALGVLAREFGLSKALLLTLATVSYGLLVAGVVSRVSLIL